MSGEHYLETFGFRGGEFGNWLNQNDRQASLNMGFEALKDLAAALQIHDKDITYQGTLAIAFGARGKGNACAYYEPLRKVINLTKMHGAGSLAHEWWHSLDDYLGVKFGAKNFLSEQAYLYPPMQQLMETIKYKLETPEQVAKRIEQYHRQLKKEAEIRLDTTVLSDLQNKNDGELLTQCAQLKEEFLNGQLGTVEKINDLKKSVTGRVIPKSDREYLLTDERLLHNMHENQEPQKLLQPRRIATDYHQNSVKMGKHYSKDGSYWDSPVELTARAFACYILDKLSYTSDYLVGHAESTYAVIYGRDGQQETITAYPVGEERKAINQAFDNLIAELKREKIFTHEEQTLPLEITLPEIPAAISRSSYEASAAISSEAEPEQLSLFAEDNSAGSKNDKPSLKEQLAAAKQASQAHSAPKEHQEQER